MKKAFAPSFLVLLLSAFVPTDSANAHPQDMGSLKIRRDGKEVAFALELDVSVIEAITGLSGSELDSAPKIAAGTIERETVTTEGDEKCAWSTPDLVKSGERIRIDVRALCPGETPEWRLPLPFLKTAPAGFELFVDRSDAPGEPHREYVLTTFDTAIDSKRAGNERWVDFVRMGIEHIGATPSQWKGPEGLRFPEGIDHILFVLALVIGGTGFFEILRTVTGFTIGHSVTLALATFGIFQVSPRIVESAIALSIAVIAFEAIFRKSSAGRWKMATAFGLVHGLGFASALAELHLSRDSLFRALTGFNLGVEFGQAVFVALFFPVVLGLRRYRATRRFAIPAIAGAIFIAGSYWFVERAFGL